MAEEILREGFADDELVTAAEYSKEIGVTLSSFRNSLGRYADRAPEVARLKNGHTKRYVRAELEEFFNSIEGWANPRSPLEVKKSKIHRLRETIQATEARVTKRRSEWEKAMYDLANYRRQLEYIEDQVKLLSQRIQPGEEESLS